MPAATHPFPRSATRSSPSAAHGPLQAVGRRKAGPPSPGGWASGRAQRRLARREAAEAFLLISPWIVGFLVFTAGPIIAGAYLSLTDYNLLRPPTWVGLNNYTTILARDQLFRTALLNTAIYTLLYVPLHMIVALGLALLLNTRARGTPIWRTFLFLPSLTPVVAMAILWRWMLTPHEGVINRLLSFVGIPGPGWTSDPNWMKPSVALMTGAWAVGNTMLIYLAGLRNIPQELYEAAKTDGAGVLVRFFRITLPMLSGVLLMTAVIGTIAAFQTFAQGVVLFDQNGGRSNAGLFYIMYLFNQAFRYSRMGYASALAWILFVIVGAFTILQFRLATRWVYHEGAER